MLVTVALPGAAFGFTRRTVTLRFMTGRVLAAPAVGVDVVRVLTVVPVGWVEIIGDVF